MHNRHSLALGTLLGALALTLGISSPAHSQRPQDREEPVTLATRLAKATGLKPAEVEKFLQALGPAIRDELAAGRVVSVDGLGSFRVVRIAAHNDLRLGRPTRIPASNTIEFIPFAEAMESANSETAVPQSEVPEFRYVPLPGQTPGQRMPRITTPPRRVR